MIGNSMQNRLTWMIGEIWLTFTLFQHLSIPSMQKTSIGWLFWNIRFWIDCFLFEKSGTHEIRQKNFNFSNYSLTKHKDHSTIISIFFQNLIRQTKYLLEIDSDRWSKSPVKSVVLSKLKRQSILARGTPLT